MRFIIIPKSILILRYIRYIQYYDYSLFILLVFVFICNLLKSNFHSDLYLLLSIIITISLFIVISKQLLYFNILYSGHFLTGCLKQNILHKISTLITRWASKVDWDWWVSYNSSVVVTKNIEFTVFGAVRLFIIYTPRAQF